MCGRFVIDYTWAEIHAAMSLIPVVAAGRNDPARHNVAPTQDIGFLTQSDGEYVVKDGRWWLVPHWATELPKYPMFNARSETVREKSSFRTAFETKRCLIPASGYYEWTKGDDGKKDPHFIYLPNKQPFCFAGLWAYNSNLDITSCTILTAAAVPEIEPLHHRMPIILDQSLYEQWLTGEPTSAYQLLNDNLCSYLQSCRVGREVGKSTATGAGLIEPL